MKIIKYIFPLTILNLIAIILVTFGLPDIVPINVGIDGVVNLFGSKWHILIIGLIPIVIAIVYIGFLYKKKSDLFELEDKIISAVVAILMPISWIPILLALNFVDSSSNYSQIFLNIEMVSIIGIILAVFFIFIAHYMEKIKPNKIIGIRTPWTLKNEIVWKKTHKLGSYTFMIGGFVLLTFSLASYLSGNLNYFYVALIISLVLIAAIPIIYSYIIYKKLN